MSCTSSSRRTPRYSLNSPRSSSSGMWIRERRNESTSNVGARSSGWSWVNGSNDGKSSEWVVDVDVRASPFRFVLIDSGGAPTAVMVSWLLLKSSSWRLGDDDRRLAFATFFPRGSPLKVKPWYCRSDQLCLHLHHSDFATTITVSSCPIAHCTRYPRTLSTRQPIPTATGYLFFIHTSCQSLSRTFPEGIASTPLQRRRQICPRCQRTRRGQGTWQRTQRRLSA